MKTWFSGALMAVAATGAYAHIGVEPSTARAGSGVRTAFRITHGCEGSPTTRVTLTVPEGVVSARPMPKPGWTLQLRNEPLAQPYELHGRRVTQRLAEVSWTGGPLENAHFDEFVLLLRLSASPGKRYFKLTQECVRGRNEWVEVPPAGGTGTELRYPAAVLDVIPVPGEHAHHH